MKTTNKLIILTVLIGLNGAWEGMASEVSEQQNGKFVQTKYQADYVQPKELDELMMRQKRGIAEESPTTSSGQVDENGEEEVEEDDGYDTCLMKLYGEFLDTKNNDKKTWRDVFAEKASTGVAFTDDEILQLAQYIKKEPRLTVNAVIGLYASSIPGVDDDDFYVEPKLFDALGCFSVTLRKVLKL